jgi:hypothetical protein
MSSIIRLPANSERTAEQVRQMARVGALSSLKSSGLTLGASWRLLERPSASVEALVGARYSYLDNKFKLEAGLLPARDKYESEDWVDPIIGLAARVTFAANWYASGWAMNAVAGDSDTNYDLFGGIGYAFNQSHSFIVGYRHIKID